MKIISLFCKTRVLFLLLFFFYFAIGLFYAGGDFLANISTAIPGNVTGGEGRAILMVPGDHFEQFYRYNLPARNVERGYPLFFSGYQYNFSENGDSFSEGLIYLPFSLMHAVLEKFVGDVGAYNLVLLLSFPLVGGAMYWLAHFLTRSHSAALLSSLVLMLLPHRTSFLFGQMVYGVDLLWIPLIVLSFEKAMRTFCIRYVAAFALFLFCYATTNFQGLYLFAVFSLVYFFVRSYQGFVSPDYSAACKWRMAIALFGSFLPTVAYLAYVWRILGKSGLSGGQAYAEVVFYSPAISHAFFNVPGNETKVFLGLPLLVALIIMLILGFFRLNNRAEIQFGLTGKSVFVLTGFSFFVSYLFCFGASLDASIGLKVYRWYFNNVPGASGNRTPGRLMNTAGFWFALYFGFLYAMVESRMSRNFKKIRVGHVLTAVLAVAVVFGYHYTKPLMVELERDNNALEKIRGEPGVVFAVPTQLAANHHFNSTFLWYAEKYNLRLFAGHSSMYPKEWDRIIRDFLPVNGGRFDRAMMKIFTDRGVTHLLVRTTETEPNVSPFVVARLEQSPFLKKVGEDKGIKIYAIQTAAQGEQIFDPETLLAALPQSPLAFGQFMPLDGWHSREAYPEQRAFRWMAGTESTGVVFGKGMKLTAAEFAYFCPLEDLSVTVNGRTDNPKVVDLDGGWKKLMIDLRGYESDSFVFKFSTPKKYAVPSDSRVFGCQVGDIEVR